jgi:hypothetical protein
MFDTEETKLHPRQGRCKLETIRLPKKNYHSSIRPRERISEATYIHPCRCDSLRIQVNADDCNTAPPTTHRWRSAVCVSAVSCRLLRARSAVIVHKSFPSPPPVRAGLVLDDASHGSRTVNRTSRGKETKAGQTVARRSPLRSDVRGEVYEELMGSQELLMEMASLGWTVSVQMPWPP